jgi:hypothetical protein
MTPAGQSRYLLFSHDDCQRLKTAIRFALGHVPSDERDQHPLAACMHELDGLPLLVADRNRELSDDPFAAFSVLERAIMSTAIQSFIEENDRFSADERQRVKNGYKPLKDAALSDRQVRAVGIRMEGDVAAISKLADRVLSDCQEVSAQANESLLMLDASQLISLRDPLEDVELALQRAMETVKLVQGEFRRHKRRYLKDLQEAGQ